MMMMIYKLGCFLNLKQAIGSLVALGQQDPRWTWSSPFDNCRRSAVNRGDPCISPSSTSQRPLTFLAEMVSSSYFAKIGFPPKLPDIFSRQHAGFSLLWWRLQRPSQSAAEWSRAVFLHSTLFEIFFSLLLSSHEGVYLHSRADGKLFNLACLRSVSVFFSGKCYLQTMLH